MRQATDWTIRRAVAEVLAGVFFFGAFLLAQGSPRPSVGEGIDSVLLFMCGCYGLTQSARQI